MVALAKNPQRIAEEGPVGLSLLMDHLKFNKMQAKMTTQDKRNWLRIVLLIVVAVPYARQFFGLFQYGQI